MLRQATARRRAEPRERSAPLTCAPAWSAGRRGGAVRKTGDQDRGDPEGEPERLAVDADRCNSCGCPRSGRRRGLIVGDVAEPVLLDQVARQRHRARRRGRRRRPGTCSASPRRCRPAGRRTCRRSRRRSEIVSESGEQQRHAGEAGLEVGADGEPDREVEDRLDERDRHRAAERPGEQRRRRRAGSAPCRLRKPVSMSVARSVPELSSDEDRRPG